MNEKELIIINGFPNNERKIQLLETQINNFKTLQLPILLISGCEIPSYILSQIDYVVINKENISLGKDFTKFIRDNGGYRVPFYNLTFPSYQIQSYNPCPNNIITKNIKLGFNLAKSLGFTKVFYTEDDNIFKEESLNWVKDNLFQINNPYKLSTVIGPQMGSDYIGAFTTFFFTSVDYFLSIFTLPQEISEWYSVENLSKYSLDKNYEGMFYDLIKTDLHLIQNLENSFLNLVNSNYIDWGVVNRYQNEHFLIDNLFNIFPDPQGNKHLFLFNATQNLLTGDKPYSVKIYFDSQFIGEPYLTHTSCWYRIPIPLEVKEVTLDISNYGIVTRNTSFDFIQNNGLLIEDL
jgi:hypothetical protein